MRGLCQEVWSLSHHVAVGLTEAFPLDPITNR